MRVWTDLNYFQHFSVKWAQVQDKTAIVSFYQSIFNPFDIY